MPSPFLLCMIRRVKNTAEGKVKIMKVSLLGDSIRMQYGPVVKELLGDEFQVWEPEENSRFSQYTLRELFDHERDMRGSDIVHWNNGHWDVSHWANDERSLSDIMRSSRRYLRSEELLLTIFMHLS